jgi:hypothetical protein
VTTTNAPITRFTAASDIDAVYEAIMRDGVVIVEGLLDAAIVEQVNADVEAAVAVANPHEEYFNPVLSAFNGEHT